jgi:hypothetical protein
MYICELEKANNFLKMQVCQGFEFLHINDHMKLAFVDKINSIENKVYFNKKLA